MTDPLRPILTRRWAVAGPVRDVGPEDVAAVGRAAQGHLDALALGAFLVEAPQPPLSLPNPVPEPESGRYPVRMWWRGVKRALGGRHGSI